MVLSFSADYISVSFVSESKACSAAVGDLAPHY